VDRPRSSAGYRLPDIAEFASLAPRISSRSVY